MKSFIAFVVTLVLAVSGGGLVRAQGIAGAGELPRNIKRHLDEVVIPVVQTGRPEFFYPILEDLFAKTDSSQHDQIEAYFASLGGKSLIGIFVDARLALVQERGVYDHRSPPYSIVQLLAKEIKGRVEAELIDIGREPAMQPDVELPENWVDSEKLFWSIHVLENRFLNLAALASYGEFIVADHFAIAKRNRDAIRVEELGQYIGFSKQVKEAYEKLARNDADLRYKDLWKAVSALKQEKDFEQRLYAAYALQDDYGDLKMSLESENWIYVADDENGRKEIRKEIEQLLADGKKHGEDVIEKSILLKVGVHWWLRGRYGMGPLANGLLKTPAAMNSPAEMFGLYMPKKPEKPISQYLPESERVPGYDRRHYFNWAVEYRPAKQQGNTQQSSQSSGTPFRGDGFFY